MEETSEQTWITRDGIANLKQGNDTSIKVFEQRLTKQSLKWQWDKTGQNLSRLVKFCRWTEYQVKI